MLLNSNVNYSKLQVSTDLYFRVMHVDEQVFFKVLQLLAQVMVEQAAVLKLLAQVMVEQATDQAVLHPVQTAVHRGEGATHVEVRHSVALVQVTLDLEV